MPPAQIIRSAVTLRWALMPVGSPASINIARCWPSLGPWPEQSGLGSGHRYSTTPSSIYKPLDHARHEIRVLRIEPGEEQDEISCRLETVSLDQRPAYDTLSYHWGSSKTSVPISVDGQAVAVSVSLFEALRGIRRRRRGGGVATLWADALCIDQASAAEKSRQVAMMGRIYSQGRQTWISLGSPDHEWANGMWSPGPRIDESLKVIRRLVRGTWRLFWHHVVLRRSRQSRLGANHVSDAVRLLRSLESREELDSGRLNDRKVAGSMLMWLILHQYWTRVWVMQEVALSSKDPICIFGKHRIPLLSLETILSDWRAGWNGQDASRDIVAGWLPDVNNGFDRCVEICLLRDEFRRKRQFDLLRCLQFTSHRHTSLAHDHVYGLYSLLSPESQSRLRPDYSLSLTKLYASVTKLVLQKEQSASVLCAATGERPDRDPSLPSWALDFRERVLFAADRRSPLSDTSRGPAWRDENIDNVTVLSLAAAHLQDEVVAVQDRMFVPDEELARLGLAIAEGNSLEPERWAKELLLHFRTIAAEVGLRPDDGDFMRIVTARVYERAVDKRFHYQEEDLLHDKLRTRFRREAERTEQQQQRQAAAAVEGDGREHLSRERSPDAALDMPEHLIRVLSSFLKKEMGLAGKNDVFFCTRQGRIGKCSGDVRLGDGLWALQGSATPFILRPSSADGAGEPLPPRPERKGEYRLVGPCLCSDLTLEHDEGVGEKSWQRINLV